MCVLISYLISTVEVGLDKLPDIPYTLDIGETGAGCNMFCLIGHVTFITQERQPKLVSFKRVICQLDFHLALKFHTHIVLEQ